jgi:dynein heavy chain 1
VFKSRSELEQQSIDSSSTSDAVTLITYVQALKRKMTGWGKQVCLISYLRALVN